MAGKAPGGRAHRKGGRGGTGSGFVEDPVEAAIFDGKLGLHGTGVERGVSRAVEWEKKWGRGVKRVTAVLGGLYR
jgi:hypothetical protein